MKKKNNIKLPKDINNNKNSILFVLGGVLLLLMIIGATYAYFAVSTVSNFGTRTINAQAGNIGTVTLDGSNALLNMSLTALDMVQGSSDITYYASSSGTTTTPTEVTIGTASVTPSTDTNYYHCTYTLSVTHTGTNDMYTAFTSGANKSTGQIILTINGTDYDFYDGWPANNQVTGEFYTNVSNPADITAGLRLINDSEINQNYLANTDIQISISLVNNSLSCAAEYPTLYWTFNDNTKTSITTATATKVLSPSNLIGTNIYHKSYNEQDGYYYQASNEDFSEEFYGESCHDIWISDEFQYSWAIGSFDNEEEFCEVVSPYYEFRSEHPSSYSECTNFSPQLYTNERCSYVEHTEKVYVKETTTNGNISREVCTNLNGTRVCLKPSDWSNVDAIKSQLEGLGLTCTKNSTLLSCINNYHMITLSSSAVYSYLLLYYITPSNNTPTKGSQATNCYLASNGTATCRKGL